MVAYCFLGWLFCYGGGFGFGSCLSFVAFFGSGEAFLAFFVVACLGGVVSSSLVGLFGGRGMGIFILEQGVFELGYFLVFGG